MNNESTINDNEKQQEKPFVRTLKNFYHNFKKNKSALFGAYLILFLMILAIAGPYIFPLTITDVNYSDKMLGPSLEYWFGTDAHGRDIFKRIIHGLKITMGIGFASTFLGGIAGIIIGIISGYYGGIVDSIIMRIMDVLLAFPGILLALALVSVFQPSPSTVIYAIAISAVPSFARIVRGSTLATRNLEYIDAMRALGASDLRIIFLHILPNISSPIIVQGSVFIATAILSASGLSFLGMGVSPPSPELGAMLNDGKDYIWEAGHIALFPGLVIMLIVLSFNLLGDGLRDALDPKAQNRK